MQAIDRTASGGYVQENCVVLDQMLDWQVKFPQAIQGLKCCHGTDHLPNTFQPISCSTHFIPCRPRSTTSRSFYSFSNMGEPGPRAHGHAHQGGVGGGDVREAVHVQLLPFTQQVPG